MVHFNYFCCLILFYTTVKFLFDILLNMNTLQNPTVEISEPRFMVGVGKDLPENAMVCVIRREKVLF